MTARFVDSGRILPLLFIAVNSLSAQGPQAPQFGCQTAASAVPTIRAEGLTELVGDVVIGCTYTGPAVPAGSPVPAFNLSLFLNTQVTSRLLEGSQTEALLFIDDPKPEDWHLNSGTTIPNTAGCSPSPQCPNLFPGLKGRANELHWPRIPIKPRVAGTETQGEPVTIRFRISNIRANASQLGAAVSAPGAPPLQITATTQIGFPQLRQEPPIVLNSVAATAVPSFDFAVRGAASLTGTQGVQGSVARLEYTELFPSAFAKQNCSISHALPRFTDPDRGRPLVHTDSRCTSNPLYPFAAQSGWYAEGIVFSKRNTDPFCAQNQTGPCGLNYYGATGSGLRLNATFKGLPAEGNFFLSTRNLNAGPGFSAYLMTPAGTPAIDQGNGFTPLIQVCPGYRNGGLCTTAWQIIDSDPNSIQTFAFQLDYSRPPGARLASTATTTATPSIGPSSGFQGYILAQAKFEQAYGFAFLSDLGAQRLAQGYLSLILDEPAQRAEAERRVGAFEIRGENISQLRPAEARISILPEGTEQAANTVFFHLTPEGYLPQRLILSSFGSTRLGNFTVSAEVDSFPGQTAGATWLKTETIGDMTPVTLILSVDPRGLAPGTYKGRVTATPAQPATGPVIPVELVVPPPGPRVRTAGVASAGSYANGVVAPGEAVVIFGQGFGPPSLIQLQLSGGTVSTNIGQTRILFDGEPAPMIYTVANQASCFVPFSVEGKKFVEVVVEYAGVASPPARVAVLPSKPALLTADASGGGIGAILTQDFTPNSVKPAKPGEFVVLFGVGGGQTVPPSVGGRLQQGIGEFKVPVRAFLDDVEVTPLYAGPAPDLVEGVFQVNLPLAANIRRNAMLPVRIQFGDNVNTQPGVFVWVE